MINVKPFDFHIKALPDECCYSFLCRCAVRIPHLSDTRVGTALFGRQHPLSQYVFKAFKTSDIANWGGKYFGWSRKDFLLNNSCLPYCSIMLADKYLSILISSLGYDTSLMRVQEMLVTRASGFNIFKHKHLRYCPECAADDLRTYGEMYWHRLPQMPGVMICPIHGAAIQESDVSYSNIQYHFITASYAIPRLRHQHPTRISSKFENRYMKLAKDTQWLLERGMDLRNSMVRLFSDASADQMANRQKPSPSLIDDDWSEIFLYHLYNTVVTLSSPDSVHKIGIFNVRHPLIYLIEIELEYGNVENFFNSL